MKITFRSTAILVIFLFWSTSSNAQESDKYKKLKNDLNYRDGYILNNDSSKVEGLIKHSLRSMDESSLYYKVDFVHKDGTKKKYLPKDIKGFGIKFFDNYISDGKLFYKILKSGKNVNLYYRLVKAASKTYVGPAYPTLYMNLSDKETENFYVRKPSEPTLRLVRKRKFVEEFSVYFSDCEKLKEKIISKQVTHEDIKSIVSEYNKCN